MKVVELKALATLEDVAELNPDARYLITFPEHYPMNDVERLGAICLQAKLNVVLVPSNLKFYIIEE